MTKIISNIDTLRKIIKASDKVINLVPTMGNIHLGHENLIKLAVKKSQISIISIFVNPLQFSEKEDFDNYPRTFNNDIKKIRDLGVNYIFSPNQSFIKNIKESSSTNLPKITRIMCGKDRPGHFRGVALIVSKLLKLINPDFIYLGEKDYQQIIVIKKLIDKLFIKTKIRTHPIVREKNGLAFSSRNSKINYKSKIISSEIFKVLKKIKSEIKKGSFLIERFDYYRKFLINIGFEKVNYLEIRQNDSLLKLDEQVSVCRLFISVQIDKIRLIDNLFLGEIKKSGQKIISF